MFLTRLFNRRKYRTLFILGLIAVIFYFLQFFSLQKLNFWNERRENFKNIHELSEIDNEERFRQELKIAEDKIKKDEENSHFLLNGVHIKHVQLYRADENGSFSCLVDKVKIPFTQVNDDFCDCKDSSDEPGTNACPHSKFYCKDQIPEDDPVFIAGSKVNDGICDCCDGSDEWTNHRVPNDIQIHDKLFMKKYSVYQTPCENHCQKGLQIRAQEQRVRRIGLKLKESYLLAAKNIGSGGIYGPRNVFYKLSMTCYSIEKTIYEYTICPFKSVSQVDFPQATFNLGKTSEWKKQEKGDYSLLMKNGDNRLCPDGIGRNTLIRFFCGLQDQPLSIKEESKCSYLVIFITPAAC